MTVIRKKGREAFGNCFFLLCCLKTRLKMNLDPFRGLGICNTTALAVLPLGFQNCQT
jgi:hypothetical protein